ncbi:uncharacterized protein JCM15063_005579 [Sporobolomyces koalae]|uniref:uncharacterized protein n=1 Tax=Sporobolomyces koalae TaxID=500713 RepID=UPI00317304E3
MSTTAASSASSPSVSAFHFAPSPSNGLSPANLSPSPKSPVSPSPDDSPSLSSGLDGHRSTGSTASNTPRSDVPTPLYERAASVAGDSVSALARPNGADRSTSYKHEKDIWGTSGAVTASSPNGTQTFLTAGPYSGAVGEPATQRTVRAASDGLLLQTGFGPTASNGFSPPAGRMSSLGSDDSSEEQAMFREHQRKSLENSANARFVNSGHTSSSTNSNNGSSRSFGSAASPSSSPFFTPLSMSSSNSTAASSVLPPLLSPTSQSPPGSSRLPAFATTATSASANETDNKGATLHLGDLDVWMDEQYVRECCKMMGWDNVTGIKMSRGASPSSGYCFITFPSPAEASRVLARFNASPPMLMPRSGRTFKLNWGTGVPGSAPKWEGEWSVFVGDLAREVGEQELMGLFTPLFPSTKSAKVMTDPSSGLSRGYGFVRFGEESDMQRALSIGLNPNSGLLLHGRTIRISEATGGASGTPGLADGVAGFKERERARTRTTSDSNGLNATAPGYFPPYPPTSQPHEFASANGPPDYHLSPYPSPFSPSLALSPNALQFGPTTSQNNHNPLSPSLRGPLSPQLAGAGRESNGPIRQPIPAGAVPPGGDPNNTTVFVGGLPACISEETLKSFFQHFGEITYCKIPTGKGCGFVQFVKRQDAELAIAKMNDFPIHGKSRIRLSWGRSQGDKQVEHVRKLASALGVPFDAVWRMVQGQDNSTIKQIASAVGGPAAPAGNAQAQQHADRQSAAAATAARMDLRAVANAAGLTEAEVLDLVKSGTPGNAAGPSSSLAERANSGSTTNGDALLERTGSGENGAAHPRNGPNGYPTQQPLPPQHQQHAMLPLSPPPSAGPIGAFAPGPSQLPPPAAHAHNSFGNPYGPPHPHVNGPFHPPPPHPAFPPPPHGHSYPQQHPGASPYNAIRPDSYVVQTPNTNPYERVDFAEGGRPTPPLLPPGNGYPGGDSFANSPPPSANAGSHGIEDSFAAMSFGNSSQAPRTLPPPRGMSYGNGGGVGVGSPNAPDFFPSALGSPTTTKFEIPAESSWSWNNMSAGHA